MTSFLNLRHVTFYEKLSQHKIIITFRAHLGDVNAIQTAKHLQHRVLASMLCVGLSFSTICFNQAITQTLEIGTFSDYYCLCKLFAVSTTAAANFTSIM